MTTGAKVQRKLTTILAADAAGYASAMDADEVGTLEALRAARSVFSKFIERHNGRIANTAGDGLIADFPSLVEAVQCAIEVQRELGSPGHPANGSLPFRIGIHLGDVIVDGEDLLGEGVNLAARLQTMAEPGGVLVSQQVYDQVHGKLTVGFEYLGEKRPKNFSEDVPVYCVSFGEEPHRRIFGRHASQQHKQTEPPRSSVNKAAREKTAVNRSETDDDGLRDKVIRNAKVLGVVWVALVIINLTTSPGSIWVQWPALAMLVALGLQAAPLFESSLFGRNYARLAVIIAAVVVVNILTWSGTAWAIWPVGFLFGSVSEVYAWAADCCGEAGPRRCPPDHADEMEPSQIAVQVLRGDAAIAAQETLQLAVAAIDRLNVEGIPDPLSGRKVQGFVANAHGRSAGRIAAMTVRNQNDVGIQNRFEHRLQGLGVDRRKNLADGCAAAIGGDQDRHLFIRQAALAGLAATLARLAIQSARSLVALKHVSLVNFDNALEFRPILACGLQETVPPAEGRIDAKSASTGRFPYRLALGQRHAE